MSPRKNKNTGPSPTELRMRSELDQARRELKKLKRELAGQNQPAKPEEPLRSEGTHTGVPDPEIAPPTLDDVMQSAANAAPSPQPPAAELLPGPAVSLDPLEMQRQINELTTTRKRLSRLYFSQVEENRKRAKKLHEILENISNINSKLDLDAMLGTLASTIRESLGFGMVLIRLREPTGNGLRARAFAGVGATAQERLRGEVVSTEEFMSWLRDDFKVSRSYFISHVHSLNKQLPNGYRADLGPREEWEWHSDDVLIVPLFNRNGDLVGYFSVDDPRDRLVPSHESIELLEIFGHHAVVAIENARLYQELEEHSLHLEEANQRMQEMHALKSNFVSAVSHELRTPLTAIRAYVDTLLGSKEGDLSSEQLRRFLGIINDESQRLARLIESVLDLNRFDSGAMHVSRQPMKLADVLEETGRLLEPVARTGEVDLKVVQDLADTHVDADRDQMRQLVLHLGSNAVKFTPPGGSVTLRLSGDARDITLQVEDTGIGIPESELDRIFERFYQVDSSLVRKYGGTGLGLAICKSIVDWHGGRVFAESTPDKGSVFTVVLPRRTGPRVAVRPQPRRSPASEDVLRLALEMVSEVMGARVVSLLCPEEDGSLIVQAAIGLDEQIVRKARIAPGQGVAGWVAENRRPVCVSGEDESEPIEGSGRHQYRSGTFLSVPIEGEDSFVGVLNVTDPIKQAPFDAEDCHLLLHLADRVAYAWDQTRAMEQTAEGVQGTAQALRQVLQHIDRGRRRAPDRVRLARALAREIGLSESEVGVISFAATIHDVGMTQVGEGTGAAGTLSAEQRETLRQHPEMGADVLRPLDTVGVVRDVVLAHHEWWDGSGYPQGLEGENIPVGGRILAVVDAYESMTVGRPHREALSQEDALVELHRLKGRQFEPRLVDAFERALSVLGRDEETAATDSLPAATQEGR